MPHSLKIAFAIVVTVASSIGVVHSAIEIRLSSSLRQRQLATDRAFAFASPSRRAMISRDNLLHTTKLLRRFPHDADLHLLAAANHRLVNRLDAAEKHYLEALLTMRRPEIFLQLGHIRLEQGRLQEAYDSYATAVRFSRLFLRDVPHPEPVMERLLATDSNAKVQ